MVIYIVHISKYCCFPFWEEAVCVGMIFGQSFRDALYDQKYMAKMSVLDILSPASALAEMICDILQPCQG